MTDADNTNDTPETSQSAKPDFDSKFQSIADQLRQMNEQFLQSQQQLINAVKPQQQAMPEPTIDPYDPDSLKNYVSKIEKEAVRRAEASVQAALQKDTQLKATLARLATEFPEINQDAETQQMVLSEHKALAKELQDTAEGYELAVSRVVNKKGLVSKSKRPKSQEPEYSASGYQGGARRQPSKKGEVSDATKMWSQLLGRDISSKEYNETMNEVSQRNLSKYGA